MAKKEAETEIISGVLECTSRKEYLRHTKDELEERIIVVLEGDNFKITLDTLLQAAPPIHLGDNKEMMLTDAPAKQSKLEDHLSS
jgi:hypothetical protein